MLASLSTRGQRAALGALVALAPLWACAQTPITPTWSSSTPATHGIALALDGANNSYVAGYEWATLTAKVTKVSPAGTLAWQRSITAADVRSTSDAIAVDATGRAVVAGTLFPPITGAARLGLVVTSLGADGTLAWQQQVLATDSYAVDVRLDLAGNAYVLGGRRNATTGAGTEAVLLKFTPDGLQQWERAFGGAPNAMTLTPSGAVAVTTMSSGANGLHVHDAAGNLLAARSIASSGAGSHVASGPAGELVVAGSGSDGVVGGYLAAKFDAAYNLLWRRVVAARGAAARVAIDGAGAVVLTGMIDTNSGGFGSAVVIPDWLTVKLDASGNPVWTHTETSFDSKAPRDVAIGRDNAIYITGEGTSAVTVGLGNYLVPSTLTIKLAPDGTRAWAANTGATSLDQLALAGVAMRLGSDDGLYVLAQTPQTLRRYAQGGLPNAAPTAMASANPSAGPAPLAVQFSAAGSSDGDGSIASYAWNFGNGVTSTAPNPAYTYATPGSYTASLVVTDAQGAASAPASVVVTVNAPPPPQPVSVTTASTSVRGGQSVRATVRVSSASGVTVALASSNPAAATLPASVSVPAGATSASFTIQTFRVRRDTPVTIRATANGATATGALTVRR